MVDNMNLCLLLLLFISVILPVWSEPTPAPWPLQFHSTQVLRNRQGQLQINELWYDWPNGRNLNIIYKQLGEIIYDLEWDNGTSYYYTREQCTTMHFPVGILRPNFLDGANYLGQQRKDGFLCNVWEKVGFIWYYEDVVTNTPVSWTFYSGLSTQVMTFEVGKVLDDSNWQAPVYCFEEAKIKQDHHPLLQSPFPLIRDV
ncbi:uncharacterized protein At4g14100-like [Salvia miltiorrhiza]|uniref:uncharacterized protein At4g14100-like n=1 Tax=Salvia miltiorrhiza TaxID=226208 RepID=UPI0025ACEBCC|nr:uncharacterized protein At4g14100-like [Salvia miltiorrhiza]